MAQTYTESVLYKFCYDTGCPNGASPFAGLAQGPDGNFYGTTNAGGNSSDTGTVFKLTPLGALTTLHDFCSEGGENCTDSGDPFDSLVQGGDGDFYGTTLDTVFKITPSGTLTTLYTFSCDSNDCPDGSAAYASLAQGADGNFYGTTRDGGANTTSGGENSDGTVFKITPSGKFTLLYSFCSQGGSSCTDGADPYFSGLVQGTDGNFYGITGYGGANPDDCDDFDCGSGTIFKITPAGKLTTLYTFCAQGGANGQGGFTCPDGSNPQASLVEGKDGNLYGVTAFGGVNVTQCENNGCGTVFKVTTSGELTTLYSFCTQGGSDCTDGAGPGSLIQASDGSFYGNTSSGGKYGGFLSGGTLF